VEHPITYMLTSLMAGCFLDTTGGRVSVGISMEDTDVSSLGPLSWVCMCIWKLKRRDVHVVTMHEMYGPLPEVFVWSRYVSLVATE